MPLTEIDGEQIIAARLRGEPEREIARWLGISLQDVRDALDRFSSTVISHHTRLHRLALDLETIDSMVETFQPMAKSGDVQAGALLAKFLESRRIMLGLELPRRADPLLVEAQAEPMKTSTERIAAVIDRLCLEAPQKPPEDLKRLARDDIQSYITVLTKKLFVPRITSNCRRLREFDASATG